MKYNFLIILAVTAIIGFTSCNSSPKGNSETETSSLASSTEQLIKKANAGNELSISEYDVLTDYAVKGYEYGIGEANKGVSRKDVKKSIEQQFPMFKAVINVIEGNEAIGEKNMQRLNEADWKFDEATRK